MPLESEIYEFDDGHILYVHKRMLCKEDSEVHIGRREFNFLVLLCRDFCKTDGTSISRETLCKELWGRYDEGTDPQLRELCAATRRVFGDAEKELHRHITTEATGHVRIANVKRASQVSGTNRASADANEPIGRDRPLLDDDSMFHPITDKYYYIVSRNTNLAIDVPRGEFSDLPLHLWTLPGSFDHQLWQAKRLENGHYIVISKCNDKCLDVWEPWASRTYVVQSRPERKEHQEWVFERTQGYVEIIAHNGATLHRSSWLDGSGNGERLWVGGSSDLESGEWDFVQQEHLLIGRHFLLDGRWGQSSSGSEEVGWESEAIVALLIELVRRRATFSCWFEQWQIESNQHEDIDELCARFPSNFGILRYGLSMDQALEIAATANPEALIITTESVKAKMEVTFRDRVQIVSPSSHSIAVPSLDIAIDCTGDENIKSTLIERLTPLRDEFVSW